MGGVAKTYQVRRQKAHFQLALELLHRGVLQVLLAAAGRRTKGAEEEAGEVRRRSHRTEGWGDVGADAEARANAGRNADGARQVLRRKRNRPRISGRNKDWIRRRRRSRRPFRDSPGILATCATLRNTASNPWKSAASTGAPWSACSGTTPIKAIRYWYHFGYFSRYRDSLTDLYDSHR